MAQDTNVENLIINKLTKAQYESITNPDPTQLYFITDDNGIASLDDILISNLSNSQILKYNSTSQKWENANLPTVDQTYNGSSANAQSGVAIQGELSTNYQSKLVSGTNIKTINNQSILGSGNIDIQGGGGVSMTYDSTTETLTFA